MKFRFLPLFLLILPSCASQKIRDQFKVPPGAVSVMAYNLENLFDTDHDAGTEDFTYLPLRKKGTREHNEGCSRISSQRYRADCFEMDWSEAVLQRKMSRLAKSILQVNEGRGPDLLLMEEVENIRVLNRLRDEYLKPAKYVHAILIEGFDKRGIDVAMLSRLPLVGEPRLHKIRFKGESADDKEWMERSRGILQADFQLADGSLLTAFGVHLPSPSNPTYWREQAIEFLNKLQSELPPDRLVLAGGDFNISGREDRRRRLYTQDLNKRWLVSHLIGCKGCQGTNYYHSQREWSFLDALLFSPNLDPSKGNAGWYVDPKSVGIPNHSHYQVNRYGSPARFDPLDPVGVSDHWPIFGVIRPRTPNQVVNK